MKKRKVTIIGAGMVGSACAYTLMQSGLFQEMTILDVNKAKAKGEALDITHGAAFVKPQVITSGDYSDTANSDIIVITAGASQKPGETRMDLIDRNLAIFKQIVTQSIKYSPNTIFLVVSNPVDILSLITFKLSGFESNRIIGSGTVLDSARLRYHVGSVIDMDPRNVHAYVLGEHGDSEFVNWSQSFVGAIPFKSYCQQFGYNFEKLTKKIEKSVMESAYEIIESKGYTNFGIAMSVKRICDAIIRNEKSVLPVSTYDPKNDIYYSAPTILGNQGKVKSITPILNKEEKEKLEKTIEVIKGVSKKIKI